MTLVYLDTETTGLDQARHQIWEIAYAVDDGPIRSEIVVHTVYGADPDALRIGGHDERCTAPPRHPAHPVGDSLWGFEPTLRDTLSGTTLVGANPAFDAAFLRTRWGYAPWKYRLLDVEAYAMPALGLTEPRGLAHIAEQLGVQAPDHTAAGDVHVLRECHQKLQAIYRDQFGDRGWEGE